MEPSEVVGIIETVLQAAAYIVAGAAALASVLPIPKYHRGLKRVRKVLDTLGFNVGRARNRDDA